MDSNPSQKVVKLSGVDIKNVDERIKLYYGPQYGVTISSHLGKGTTVLIKMEK